MTTTTYILTGGRDRVSSDYGHKLAAELHQTHKTFKLLSCFAEPVTEHPGLAVIWRDWFEKHVGSIESYDYARRDIFLDQVKKADIIYLHGGQTKILQHFLEHFDNLKGLFLEKTIIGSSAGANLIASDYWSARRQRAFKGLGLLDIAVMAHYGEELFQGKRRTRQDWEHEEQLFQEVIGPAKKIIHLPERQLTVIRT